MLQLFRVNDPFRLILILGILILLRIPFVWQEAALSAPELSWLLVGEKVRMGDWLYSQTWEHIAPFSGWLYASFHYFFGRSEWALRVFAIILVFLQAILFNNLLLKREFFKERSYLPALLYVIVMSYVPDFMRLSPMLIALTFLLMIMRRVFTLEEKTSDARIFSIGVLAGLAYLFHYPTIIFLIWIAIGLNVFRSTNLRQYMLMLFGFSLPFFAVFIFLYYTGGLRVFLLYNIFSFFQLSPSFSISLRESLWLFAPLVLVLLWSLFKVFSKGNYINFQTYCHQMMVLWLILSVLMLPLCYNFDAFQFVVFVPMIAFFMSYAFLNFKRQWLAELYFLTIMGFLVAISLHWEFRFVPEGWWVDLEKTEIKAPASADFAHQNKKILVLGSDKSFYMKNQAVTPYLNWDISQRHFGRLNYYDIMIGIFDNIKSDMPELIIDIDNKNKVTFERIPLFYEYYEPKADSPFIYQRKANVEANK
ncbi:MAG: glycosyltransferase family 39 protein [Bernardetiaceae bacterium]|nr:glycosyltransferase family 39 protein [Bernardetiaceae bacterium]